MFTNFIDFSNKLKKLLELETSNYEVDENTEDSGNKYDLQSASSIAISQIGKLHSLFFSFKFFEKASYVHFFLPLLYNIWAKRTEKLDTRWALHLT